VAEALPKLSVQSRTIPNTPTGLEPDSVSSCNAKDLAKSTESSGAESGADFPKSEPVDTDLQHVIDAWSDLPKPIRIAILGIVREVKR